MFVCCVCCQVEVSATSWSVVQRSPTDCDASLCVIKKPRGRGGHSPRWAAEPEKNWDGKSSGYAENPDNFIFLCKYATLTIWISALTLYILYLRLNLPTTHELKLEGLTLHCIWSDDS
jgi:hypothetical protein